MQVSTVKTAFACLEHAMKIVCSTRCIADAHAVGSLRAARVRRLAVVGSMALAAGMPGGAALAADQPFPAYPFTIDPTVSTETLPLGDGQIAQYQSDSWYEAGFVTGQITGNKYAFMTIFDKNHNGTRTDFYQFALFNLQTGAYGTSTDFDILPLNLVTPPKLSMQVGFLGLNYSAALGPVSWQNDIDASGNLVPFVSTLSLLGKDQTGSLMQLNGTLTMARAPYASGGSTLHGLITFFGQANTVQYGAANTIFNGTLHWGAINEPVSGTIGHYDRQQFPQFAGVDQGLGYNYGHEWVSIQLDDGTELSAWYMFDRTNHDAPVPFTGITASDPGTGVTPTEYSPDLTEEFDSYVRFPFSSLPPFPLPVPSNAMWMPNLVHLKSSALQMNLIDTPLVPAPGHVLPVPYMTGPAMFSGTYKGVQHTGIGFFERSLGLYQNFELVTALSNSAQHLPSSAYSAGQTSAAALVATLAQVQSDLSSLNNLGAYTLLRTSVGPALQTLTGPSQAYMLQLYNDLLNTEL